MSQPRVSCPECGHEFTVRQVTIWADESVGEERSGRLTEAEAATDTAKKPMSKSAGDAQLKQHLADLDVDQLEDLIQAAVAMIEAGDSGGAE